MNLQTNFRNFFGVDALTALNQIHFDELEQIEDSRSKVYQMISTDREIWQSQELDSLGVFSATNEGELAAKDSFNQAYSKTFRPVKYAKVIGISDEMMVDERWGLIQKMVKSLARSGQETKNLLAFNVFNNAFSSEKSADGVAIISASHPSQIGNQSNTLAVAADLSYSTLAEMEKIFRSTKDGRGKQMLIQPKVLLVSEADRHNAIELLKSPYKANTANNNINALDSGLEIVSSPYLTDADAYFMLAAPSEHGLKIVEREGFKTRTDEDVLAGVLYYKSEFRQTVGCDKWRGIVGTAGA